MRTFVRLTLALSLIALVGASAAFYGVPDVRWRMELAALKATGQIHDISFAQLLRMMAPGSGFYLKPLVDTRNPFSAISNPFTTDQHVQAGRALFASLCVACHGADANGGGTAPGLAEHNLKHGDSDWAIYRAIERGIPGTAMPAHVLAESEVWSIVAYIRRLQAAGSNSAVIASAPEVTRVTTARLLASREEPQNWLTYSGSYDGARHSRLNEINRENANRVMVKWVHQFSGEGRYVTTTPIVNNGVMYVTEPPNIVHAIDPRSGKTFWTYTHQNEQPISHCCGEVNRGVAIHEDSVYMGTMDNHLVALDAATGELRWKVKLTEHGQGASISAAPLVVGDKVIVGFGGGDYGIRGFLDALSVKDGSRVWRFHTIPGPGESGHETWSGNSWERGGGGTWLTGVYDPELRLLYWAVGNPGPDYQGESRQGDNLYTNSVVALDPETGKLKWHFQFTPHDERNWAANQVPALVDLPVNGQKRKLMLWANRNGFFYSLDRATGEFLFASPFAKQNWARSIDAKGRPVVNESVLPDVVGRLTYPGVIGATNWQSPTFSPVTGLMYVPALEWGHIIYKDAKPADFRLGTPYLGGGWDRIPGSEALYFSVRAIDPLGGKVVWSYDSPKRRQWWKTGGLVSTAGDIIFGGDNTDLFILDATNGRELWRMNVGGRINASPITYQVNGRQMFTLAAGRSIVTVGLP